MQELHTIPSFYYSILLHAKCPDVLPNCHRFVLMVCRILTKWSEKLLQNYIGYAMMPIRSNRCDFRQTVYLPPCLYPLIGDRVVFLTLIASNEDVIALKVPYDRKTYGVMGLKNKRSMIINYKGDFCVKDNTHETANETEYTATEKRIIYLLQGNPSIRELFRQLLTCPKPPPASREMQHDIV